MIESLQEVLPPPPIDRWTPRRKLLLLVAVIGRQLTTEEACRRYGIGEAELADWFAAFKRFGPPGLSPRRLQALRRQQGGRRPP